MRHIGSAKYPRAAKRYGNGLLFALPMLKDQTNAVDLLLIEAVRAFFPEAYDLVRKKHVEFSGLERGGRREEARCARLLQPLMDDLADDHADAIKALLGYLFPRLESAYNKCGYGEDFLPAWARDKRISSPYYCARYFSYAVHRNDVSDALLAELISAAAKREAAHLRQILMANLCGPKAGRLIEKLRLIEGTIDPTAAEALSLEIAKNGNEIPHAVGLFGSAQVPTQAAILVSHLLRRIPDFSKRTALAEEVIKAGEPLWFAGECLRWLHVTDRPEQEDRNTLSREQQEAVRQVLVARLKARAAMGAPFFDPDLPRTANLLYEWSRAEGRHPVQAHLLNVFDNEPSQVARFLQTQAPIVWSSDRVQPNVGDLRADALDDIDALIDLDTLAGCVRRHCSGNFDNLARFPDESMRPLEQRLAEQFMYLYNDRKSKGEDQNEAGERAEAADSKPPGEVGDARVH